MDLRAGILATAKAIGADPLDLATAISYETAGTFNPRKKGPTTQWGQHEGLIQFGQPQQKQFGVDLSNDETAFASQLGPNGAVAKYLSSNGFKPGMSGLDLFSTINAGAPGRYRASDANNGGAPGSVADKWNNQMAGHREKAAALLGMAGDAAMTGGAGNDTMEAPMAAPEQRGLLGGMLPEKAQSFLSADRIARTQMALEGMTLNPNRGVMLAAQQGIQDRAQTAKNNKTAEWLAKSGRIDLAEAVASGAIDARAAVAAAMEKTKDVRGVVVNGRLVNPVTGEVIGDYSEGGSVDLPASVVEAQWRAREAGLEPGTSEYQEFILNNGGDPATFRALDMQARAAGLEPGTQGYEDFMATRGAGLQAGARTTATNVANIQTGGEAARTIASGTAAGKADVERSSDLSEMQRNLPGLMTVVGQLDELAGKATYTAAGRLADEARKQVGLPPSEAAVARAEYIAIVDNQVLPLLRQTFGAAFTAKEGETLRATLGDADKSPEEKRAVLNAFLAQKIRDLEARGGSVPAVPSFDPKTPDFSKMSDEELQAYISRDSQ